MAHSCAQRCRQPGMESQLSAAQFHPDQNIVCRSFRWSYCVDSMEMATVEKRHRDHRTSPPLTCQRRGPPWVKHSLTAPQRHSQNRPLKGFGLIKQLHLYCDWKKGGGRVQSQNTRLKYVSGPKKKAAHAVKSSITFYARQQHEMR